MTTTLQRLVQNPHAAVFDKSPDAELAFRLRHISAVSWSIAEGGLQAVVGSQTFTYDLRAYTVGQLATKMIGDGFDVLSVSPALSGFSAMVLVEGSGDQLQSNGDRVTGFTSLLWTLLSSYSGELRDAKAEIGQALRQMVITQSEGYWVDLWGTLYAEGRRPSDTDAAYGARIPKEAFRVRVNALAIEQAILDATGDDVRILEPWKFQFILDDSTLSGPCKFYDGDTVGYHLIQPVSTQVVDWAEVLPVVERNRAAGVLVLPPRSYFKVETNANIGGIVAFSTLRARITESYYEDRPRLDYSDISEAPIINHTAFRGREVRHFSWSGITPIYPGPSDYLVHSGQAVDYRSIQAVVDYSSQYWMDDRSWLTVGSTWSDFNVIIETKHTRLS